MTDAAFLPSTELVRLYRTGELSPVEATQAALDQISRHNLCVNAFCLVDEESALAAARGSEERYVRGEPLGPLDGVPTSIKDLVLTRGWPTLRGSRVVQPDQTWEKDAPATASLRESGAVLLGKTTTPEYGWKGVTDRPLTGVTTNPLGHDPYPRRLLGQRGGDSPRDGLARHRHRWRRLGAHPGGV